MAENKISTFTGRGFIDFELTDVDAKTLGEVLKASLTDDDRAHLQDLANDFLMWWSAETDGNIKPLESYFRKQERRLKTLINDFNFGASQSKKPGPKDKNVSFLWDPLYSALREDGEPELAELEVCLLVARKVVEDCKKDSDAPDFFKEALPHLIALNELFECRSAPPIEQVYNKKSRKGWPKFAELKEVLSSAHRTFGECAKEAVTRHSVPAKRGRSKVSDAFDRFVRALGKFAEAKGVAASGAGDQPKDDKGRVFIDFVMTLLSVIPDRGRAFPERTRVASTAQRLFKSE